MALPAPAQTRSALLVLEDGRTFRGESFGAVGETFGEAVFSTGMSGYQETLTDPSYHRQVVVMTAPHIGNTGMNDEDPESSRIWVAGYVVRDPARTPSNWRSVRGLGEELRDQGVVGISGVDTRALTRHIRERGAMRVGISTIETDPERLLAKVLASGEMAGANLSEAVSTSEAYVVPAQGERRFTVAAIDLGIKANTPRMMSERGMDVHVMPATSTLEEVQAVGPDGLFFSNGPGDPSATTAQVELLQGALRAGLPYFGICSGSTTTEFGDVTVSHVCLNDDVVEGLELRDAAGELTSFSVQYHPEAAAGPHDAAYLFDRFADLMTTRKGA